MPKKICMDDSFLMSGHPCKINNTQVVYYSIYKGEQQGGLDSRFHYMSNTLFYNIKKLVPTNHCHPAYVLNPLLINACSLLSVTIDIKVSSAENLANGS